ncbi:DUF1194 domain-containing protein [Wenxinia marina]|uniref:VWFA domain-containing protein n=1 Tax=Wenxinia marina DSM 24838 TaxID=1123501 RepID=A0A0D0Q6P2_9RHOB|nr:DUF1194 domain-containing protein [Wenxinia marina]KIQ70104.1 hypothetical protein Wenmar_01676 [Wenxinia marina DSM 24838]GGL63487.1 hypothetical protein GCM10011392_17750 [Wenxinia marina]
MKCAGIRSVGRRVALARAALAWLFVLLAGPAAAECRQALVLGLDVSGSVDEREYRLQVEGLANALGAEEVREALLSVPGQPVRLAVFEWSGPQSQSLILPWAEIGDAGALDAAIARIRGAERQPAQLSTAIGAAMAAGFRLLGDQGDCLRRTLDLSGDGESNTGTRPSVIRERFLPEGVTVNGLVVGAIPGGGDDRSDDIRRLAGYFEANVTGGPGAFVEMALGYDDYEAAMRRKLLREIASMVIGRADVAEDGGG